MFKLHYVRLALLGLKRLLNSVEAINIRIVDIIVVYISRDRQGFVCKNVHR